jgi:hypothetical protein
MPFVQTTMSENMEPGAAGQIANMEPRRLISRTVETVAGIPFGMAVEQGAADMGCILYNGGTLFMGVTVRERSATPEFPNGFDEGESARLMTAGCIWVVCASGCTVGDAVFVRPSNGDWQDSNANSAIQWPGARWDTTAAAGELAILRLAY